MDKEIVIIVGAGVAGLVLAREISANYKIIILEAGPIPGGRINSIKEYASESIIEAGAEFIHGHLPETFKLLREAGIEAVPVEGKMYSKKNGILQEQEEMIGHWDVLLQKMKRLRKDMTLHDFLQLYFGENEYAELRQRAADFTEGFDLADVKKVSTKSLYTEWSHDQDENFRIPAGYPALVDFLVADCRQKGCEIFYNKLVKKIDWQKNSVRIHTEDAGEYIGAKVVITVPISILQTIDDKASISFNPEIKNMTDAARQIGFGNVVKIILRFNEAFWKPDAGFILSEELIPTWWTQLPNETSVLTGWAGGNKSHALNNNTDVEVLNKAVASLANIFDLPAEKIRENLISFNIFNWQQNEFARGAYSYSTPDSMGARAILNQSTDNTIFFSGEALYDGPSPGTVEAAIVHAQQTALKIY